MCVLLMTHYIVQIKSMVEYLVGFVDPGWDPLPWIIEETHKRGIEFHAWLTHIELQTVMQ